MAITMLMNYEPIVVVQKDNLKCTPAACEWMARWAGKLTAAEADTFQDNCDVRLQDGLTNTFERVAQAAASFYPAVVLTAIHYGKGNGDGKIAAVENFIRQQIPCAISLAFPPDWHTFAVVYFDDEQKVLGLFDPANGEVSQRSYQDIIQRHENMAGGDDIAWLAI